MAGLLDFLSTPEGRLGLGLLSAAGPQATPMSFGQRVQQGMQTSDDSQNQLMRQKFLQSQIDENSAQVEARKAAVERAQNIQRVLAGATASGGPIDYQNLIRQGVPIELVKGLAESPNFGRSKVTRTAEVEGPNGKQIVQLDDYGQPVGDPLNGYVAPQLVNQGNRQTFVKPSAGVSLPMGMSPSEQDASSRGWANVGIAREKMAFDKNEAGGGQKAPAGYRWKADGSLEAIPGGPSDNKVGGPGAKIQDAKDVLGILDMAEPLLKKSTGSYAGTGIDMAARTIGVSTEGAEAAAQLKALQGSLISKMPKMSGPQSDKDVQLYREMAGQIGDSTLPIGTRKAAITIIRELNEKYAGQPAQQSDVPAKPAVNLIESLPKTAPKGARARDTTTGKILTFDGFKWKE
jgi:hypothetical protein